VYEIVTCFKSSRDKVLFRKQLLTVTLSKFLVCIFPVIIELLKEIEMFVEAIFSALISSKKQLKKTMLISLKSIVSVFSISIFLKRQLLKQNVISPSKKDFSAKSDALMTILVSILKYVFSIIV
jgi:hypothetical protein